MSSKVVGASAGHTKAAAAAVKSSPVALLSEPPSGDDTDDELLAGINLFDYLVESTLHMDTNKNSSFSSIVSASSTASRRRGHHQLRVKRYTESGDEVPQDRPDGIPESAPTGAAHSHHESSSSLHSNSGKLPQHGGHRAGRAKRYHTVDIQPSPIQSDVESDMDGTYGLDSFSNSRMGLNMSAVENEHDQSYIFEDQESGEELPQYKRNVSATAAASTVYKTKQAVPTRKDDRSGNIFVDLNDENDSRLSAHGTSTGLSNAYNVRGGKESTTGQKPRELSSVQRKANIDEPQKDEKHQQASIPQERESILKRRSPGLAGTDDLGYKNVSTRRVHVGEPLQVDGASRIGDGKPISEEEEGNIRMQRIHELEQRKRELEALAKDAAIRRAASNDLAEESYVPRKKTSGSTHRARTVNIDVYTGEVIGEMPKINESLKVEGRSKFEQDDSSSVQSSTEYDLPITKASRNRRLFFFVFLLVALILGLSFGVAGDKDKEDNAETPETGEPASSPPLDVPTSGNSPTDGLMPTLRPSLRPPTTPMESATTVPSYEPTTPPSFGTLNPTTDPFNNTDPGLADLVLAAWPTLLEAIREESSPQLRALEWLSSDGDLDTYSPEQKLQRFALATFYFSTGGSMWIRDDGWLSTDNECTWLTSSFTAPCDQNGFYISLELNNNNLNGTLPAELALLSNNLITLNLVGAEDESSLYGTIPTELGLLTQLQFFNVRGHALEGPIPSEFVNIAGLRRLIVRQNMISGVLPSQMGVWTDLRFLELEDNRIGGSLPSEVGMLTLLESILLSRNQLTGDIPSQIGQLTLMTTFSASMNGFTSIPTEIGNLASLISIDMVGNKLRGFLPTEVGRLSNLSRMAFGKNTLSGSIPTTIGNLILVQENLDLSENQLSGTIPTEMGRLILLRQLLLNSNQLTGQIPTEFQALSRLNTLRVESNILSGSVPDSVCAVFDNSLPLFVTDCFSNVTCDCCTHCCRSQGGCECLFPETSDLQYRCIGFP